jgi:DNA-binding CsgD family transcriptional regulator
VNPRIVQSERRVPIERQRIPMVIVINGVGEVRSTFAEPGLPNGLERYLRDDATRLLPEIEAAVMMLIEALNHREDSKALHAVLDVGSVMRLSPLLGPADGPAEKMYAMVIEADRNQECVARAVSRYQLTNRQTEVLLHVLDGANAGEVARAVRISEYTAQGYVKTLLTKTGSRSRAAMVAKILGWPGARQAGAGAATPTSRSGAS